MLAASSAVVTVVALVVERARRPAVVDVLAAFQRHLCGICAAFERGLLHEIVARRFYAPLHLRNPHVKHGDSLVVDTGFEPVTPRV